MNGPSVNDRISPELERQIGRLLFDSQAILADQFGVPVHAIGIGEQAGDMQPFSARDYARSLMGLPA